MILFIKGKNVAGTSAYHHFRYSKPEQQVDLGLPFHTANLIPEENEMEILLVLSLHFFFHLISKEGADM